jgi:hypothetical protein
MKINHLTLAICIASISYLATSCKKKTSDPVEETAVVTTPPVNKLCDGSGNNVYYPLDSLNTWTYNYKISGVQQSISPTPKVISYQTYLSKKFALIKDAISFSGDVYMRVDNGTNNVYQYDSNTGMEYLEIPGTPTLNQTWTSIYNRTSTVTNLSASKATSNCSYTGLLEITVVSGTVSAKYYYKKGLGKVYSIESGQAFGNDEYTLKSVTLK